MTLRLLLVAGSLMLFLFGVYKLHNWRTKQNIEKYLEPYQRTDELISTRLNTLKSERQLTEEEKVATLYLQYKILTDRKTHHKELATYFISNYYASLLVVLFSAIGCGILIFLIATKGWGKTSNYIKVSFLALVFMAAFYAIFPNVFGQKQNFESNLAAFIKYDNLQYEIFNYMTVRDALDSLSVSHSTDSMITYINNRIIELNNMYISTDNEGLKEINEMMDAVEGKEMPPRIPQIPSSKKPVDPATNP
ncbi:MAG: hypothetical protein D6730_15385 [Bacteroidetes bacterium]|nr:MAG: hypothetical protein D6730_15385 [Bacteroidota bacterium]